MMHVCLTLVLVTLVETVSVSALLWLLMLNPVIKLASVYDGEAQRSAVSKHFCCKATINIQNIQLDWA